MMNARAQHHLIFNSHKKSSETNTHSTKMQQWFLNKIQTSFISYDTFSVSAEFILFFSLNHFFGANPNERTTKRSRNVVPIVVRFIFTISGTQYQQSWRILWLFYLKIKVLILLTFVSIWKWWPTKSHTSLESVFGSDLTSVCSTGCWQLKSKKKKTTKKPLWIRLKLFKLIYKSSLSLKSWVFDDVHMDKWIEMTKIHQISTKVRGQIVVFCPSSSRRFELKRTANNEIVGLCL